MAKFLVGESEIDTTKKDPRAKLPLHKNSATIGKSNNPAAIVAYLNKIGEPELWSARDLANQNLRPQPADHRRSACEVLAFVITLKISEPH